MVSVYFLKKRVLFWLLKICFKNGTYWSFKNASLEGFLFKGELKMFASFKDLLKRDGYWSIFFNILRGLLESNFSLSGDLGWEGNKGNK